MKKNIEVQKLELSYATQLTLADRRLYNYLLHHAFDKLSRQLDFIIPCADLQGVYGVNLPPTERLQESLRRLLRTLVEFQLGNGRWVVIALLTEASLNMVDETLSYSYSQYCRELYASPFNLERCLIQAHFTLKYSNLLYELLAAASFNGQTSLTIEVADLKSHLLIKGNKFNNFSDFDRFVLTPALAEINAYASFATKFHTERKGMRVLRLVFELTNKRNIFAVSAKDIIPPKRPRFFIDNPALERAYSFLLNAETKVRRQYFNLALKAAAKQKQIIEEDSFDRPDLWFHWVENALLKATVS